MTGFAFQIIEKAILYPFIGSWNPRLLESAGHDFKIITEFKKKILDQLKKWVYLEDHSQASYYEKFVDFAKECNYSLRVFSLNYDLCFEKNVYSIDDLERGFDTNDRTWDWRRFEPREEFECLIYLYKLHGSIDWKREKEQGNILKEVENIPDMPDLIFGTDYKMQYVDPYLFYAYELRKYTLMVEGILVVGYSFRDEHINGILEQALQNKSDRKLIVVSPNTDKKTILNRLQQINESQLITFSKSAKDFLCNDLNVQNIEKIIREKT